MNYDYPDNLKVMQDYLQDSYTKSLKLTGGIYDRAMENATGVVTNSLYYFVKSEIEKFQHQNQYQIDKYLNEIETIKRFLDSVSFSIDFFYFSTVEHHHIDKYHANTVRKRMRYLLSELRLLLKDMK